ncbi:MAG: D-alanyl-D-alanine carboxypeptidase/D-alanyl-D-alanine-endopeptidase [Planctomycetota bacterium]
MIRNFNRVWAATMAVVLLTAAPSTAQTSAKHAELAGRVREIVGDYEQQSGATVGLCVRSADGPKLISRHGAETFVPASNQKLMTAAFAIAELGDDYSFTTRVLAKGSDLYVVGGFDPTLGDARIAEEKSEDIYSELDRWSKAAREHLGDRPVGRIYLAVRKPDGPYRPAGWPAGQHQRWYAAPVAALNFNNNCYGVGFKVHSSGVIEPRVTPQSRFIRVLNKVKRSSRHVWSMSAAADESTVTLRGQVSTTTPDPLPVAANDPPLLLGRVFADRLVRAGVGFDGAFEKVSLEDVPVEAVEITRTETPLRTVLDRSNKRSLNMAAECMLLAAGDGTWPGSASGMRTALQRRFELPAGVLSVRDGSGLSAGNRVSPEAMVRVLTELARDSGREVLLSSLAVSGEDGTLENRLSQSGFRGRVAAKTGYIRGSSCLSGYVLDVDNKPAWVFSILVNDVPAGQAWRAKNLQDAICRELVKALGD